MSTNQHKSSTNERRRSSDRTLGFAIRGIRSNRLADGVMKKVMCDNKSCGDHFNDRFAMCEKLTKCIDRSAALRHLTFAIWKTRRGHSCRKRASIFPSPFASKLCHLQCVCILMCIMCLYLYRCMYNVYLYVHGRQKAPRFRDLDLGGVRVRVLRIRYPRLGTWFWGPLVSGRRNLGAAVICMLLWAKFRQILT